MLLVLFRKCVVKQRDEIPRYNKIINKPFLRTVCSNISCEKCLFKNILMHLPLKQQKNSFSLTHLLDNLLLHETQKYLKLLPLLYQKTWELVELFSGTKNFSYRICYENIGGKYSRNLVKSARENLATLSFHFIEIQVTNQMMLRHEKTIHYYIQKTSSKQIQRKK